MWRTDASQTTPNSESRFPGYKASVDHVLRSVRRFPALTVRTQEFNVWFTQTFEISLTVDGTSIPIQSFTGTVKTPNSKMLTAPLTFVPENDVRGTACDAADYTDAVSAAGKIVLLKRGGCLFSRKVSLAKLQGAVGVVVYNDIANATGVTAPLGLGTFVPAGFISMADGRALVKQLQAGEKLSADFLVDAIGEDRTTWNVIAETKGGDPGNVIVVRPSTTLSLR